MPAISITFSALGSTKPKFLSLDPLDALVGAHAEPLCSLNLEHVTPDALARQEIERHTPLGAAAETALRKHQPMSEATLLALLRKWFWSRKPTAGFLLTGFPATLLHAKVFDEWLDARGESLDGVICGDHKDDSPVAAYYRDQGLSLALPSDR